MKTLYSWNDQALNDAFDQTIVSIHLRRKQDENKTYIFCGCGPQVGATAVSINLAIAMARSGWKTVLIDADMRKAQSVKRLAEGARNGDKHNLAGYLSGGCEIADMISDTNYVNLSYIEGGNPRGSAIQLLCSSRLRTLLESLKNDYDYIIIDAPAPDEVADTCILAKQADGVVLVSQWNVTTMNQIQRAQRKLDDSGTSVIGTVVNRMDPHDYLISRNS